MERENATIPPSRRGFLNRRGLVAGVAAVMGAAIGRLGGAQRVEATHSVGTGGPANSDGQAMHVDLVNLGTQRTFLVATVAGNPPMVIFNGSGPFSIGQADAIQGITRSNVGFAAGLQGRNQAPSGQSVGVYGTTSSTAGTGVFGTSGLLGGTIPTAASGVGVFGNGGTSGVGGRSTTGNGVFGESTAATGWGVSGMSPFVGVGGLGTQYGMFAASNGYGGFITASGAGSVGLYATGASYAGLFVGPVVVFGDFAVTGAKNALVPHPDGSHRRLYSEESTESWFSDYGEGRLVNGRSTVPLDRDFAGVVHGDNYRVFLTPKGDSNGLYVSSQSPTGFEVRESKGGTSSLAFDYRVVAKRKDIPGNRLERVDVPPRPNPPTGLPEMPSAVPGTPPGQRRGQETRTDVEGGPPVITPR